MDCQRGQALLSSSSVTLLIYMRQATIKQTQTYTALEQYHIKYQIVYQISHMISHDLTHHKNTRNRNFPGKKLEDCINSCHAKYGQDNTYTTKLCSPYFLTIINRYDLHICHQCYTKAKICALDSCLL
jgi:hypothetical protein